MSPGPIVAVSALSDMPKYYERFATDVNSAPPSVVAQSYIVEQQTKWAPELSGAGKPGLRRVDLANMVRVKCVIDDSITLQVERH